MKQESEKIGLKLNIQKTKIMASGPNTSWEIYGEKVETVSDYFLGGVPKSLKMVIVAVKLKDAYSLEGKLWPTWIANLKAESLLSQQNSIKSRLWFMQWSCMDIKVGQRRKLSAEKLRLLNSGVGEDSWESLVLQGDPTSPSWSRSVLGAHWKDWCWSWNSNTLATSFEELTHWKRTWCWEGLGVGGEGDDRGWDGWMASPTWWTWVWVNSRSGWWTGRPGMLWFMGSQRVRHDWETELNWTECFGKYSEM